MRDIKIVTNFNGEAQMVDLLEYSFVKNREIYLIGEINDEMAVSVITQLRYLSEQSEEDITLYINSVGGSVTAGFAIFDVIKGLECDVSIVCMGLAASMGAFLLSSGTKGKRKAYKNSEIMIHQPLGGIQGQASDIELTAKHILYIKDKLNGILAENCSKKKAEIAADTDRDNWMSAETALAYGLIDEVI